jgi:hypothetical protein
MRGCEEMTFWGKKRHLKVENIFLHQRIRTACYYSWYRSMGCDHRVQKTTWRLEKQKTLTCRRHLLRAAAVVPEGAICESIAPDTWKTGNAVYKIVKETNPRHSVSAYVTLSIHNRAVLSIDWNILNIARPQQCIELLNNFLCYIVAQTRKHAY